MKSKCYNCIHRHEIPGDAHSFCDKWDANDNRKPPKKTIEEVRRLLKEQANVLTGDGIIIESIVLDVRLP